MADLLALLNDKGSFNKAAFAVLLPVDA